MTPVERAVGAEDAPQVVAVSGAVVPESDGVGPKIVAQFIYPPIPIRTMDWCAFRDGQEERGGYGYGATEAEPIADLLEIENG